MRFETPLIPARLIRRYKRFLSDVRFEDGREAVAHCPNPGSMMGLAVPDTEVWLEPNDDPKKKLRFGWRLARTATGAQVVVDTGIANRVAGEALRNGWIAEAAGYSEIRSEVRFGTASRVDFLAIEPGLPDLYVEVKSVTLSRHQGQAEFPDAVTKRGAKHLDELAAMRVEGHRAAMLYLLQRDDCDRFTLARDIDRSYGAAYDRARVAGVEIWCYGCRITHDEVVLTHPVHVVD